MGVREVNRREVWRDIGATASIHQESNVPRKRGDQKFTKNEIKRLMRLAEDQGVAKYRIAIAKTGELTLTVDNSPAPAIEPTNNDLDQWIMRHEG
jgi:hypothetical protein